jgi:gluconokinase
VNLANASTLPIVVMGVSGAGKSTVGVALAADLSRPFLDADDLHPAGNKQKMAAGTPLTDADRVPWLEKVGARIGEGVAAGEFPVVACSALKRAYRDRLRDGGGAIAFVLLDGAPSTLAERVALRSHEYMPATLLESQLAALEYLQPDEVGISAPIELGVGELVATIERDLAAISIGVQT